MQTYCKYVSEFKMVMTWWSDPFSRNLFSGENEKGTQRQFISLFISTSWIRAKNGEQDTCPLTGNYLNELWYTPKWNKYSVAVQKEDVNLYLLIWKEI